MKRRWRNAVRRRQAMTSARDAPPRLPRAWGGSRARAAVRLRVAVCVCVGGGGGGRRDAGRIGETPARRGELGAEAAPLDVHPSLLLILRPRSRPLQIPWHVLHGLASAARFWCGLAERFAM